MAWPNRVTHQSRKMRALYILGKLAFLPCLYAAFFYTLGTTRTHLIVSHISVLRAGGGAITVLPFTLSAQQDCKQSLLCLAAALRFLTCQVNGLCEL